MFHRGVTRRICGCSSPRQALAVQLVVTGALRRRERGFWEASVGRMGFKVFPGIPPRTFLALSAKCS